MLLETQAIKTAWVMAARKFAVKFNQVRWSGHLLGAAGGVEAVFSISGNRDQVRLLTVNLDNPDESLRIWTMFHIPARPNAYRYSHVQLVGFWWHYTVLLISNKTQLVDSPWSENGQPENRSKSADEDAYGDGFIWKPIALSVMANLRVFPRSIIPITWRL